MNIRAKTVDFYSQRYITLGDYFHKNERLNIHISDTGNPHYNFLILVHELLEEYLTRYVGIKEKDITKFDMKFENGDIKDSSLYTEPGNHLKSPYRKQHRFSENIERLIAHEMGIDFNDYDKYLCEFLDSKIKNKRKEINPAIGK